MTAAAVHTPALLHLDFPGSVQSASAQHSRHDVLLHSLLPPAQQALRLASGAHFPALVDPAGQALLFAAQAQVPLVPQVLFGSAVAQESCVQQVAAAATHLLALGHHFWLAVQHWPAATHALPHNS